MFKNYFKTAWRNLIRNKIFSIIKIAGLSIGLTVCMLILLYTKDEISYDRFHENQARIYRVDQTWKFGNDPPSTMGITNMILAENFKTEIPEVQQFVRINGEEMIIKRNNEVFTENVLFVDNNFFSVFTFPLIKGNPASILTNTNSIVLSEESAKKYFGTADVIGKILQLKMSEVFDNFTVTGLAKNPPQNSTIKFKMLLPFEYYKKYSGNMVNNWIGGSINTFLLLSPNVDTKTVENKIGKVFADKAKLEIEQGEKQTGIKIKISLGLQPLTDIHLNTQLGPDNGLADGSNPVYSYILTAIAIFILIIACINFVNLATAQSLKRSKEIGIRKVLGSGRMQLIRQFLSESFVISLIAFVIALVLIMAILPFFNELANKQLSLAYLSDAHLYAGFFLLLLITSFIAGFYPSLVLSGFEPVKALYSRAKLMGKNYFTKGLIVLQFALAIFLIIGTIAVYSQLNFLLNADMGYDSKNLVRINLPYGKLSNTLPALVKNELANKNSILSIAPRNGGRIMMAVRANGKQITIDNNKIDGSFLPTFKIPIVSGRNFSPGFPSDSVKAAIVNESFIKEAGWSDNNSVGKSISFLEGSNKLTIIGVIKDYHFASLKEKISPQLFSMDTSSRYGQIWVRIRPNNIPKTLALLEHTYKTLVPLFPYDYQFMDNINAQNYDTEAKWKQIISIAAGLFIFISCIGLFGLVLLSIEQRTKEIGIRKVLGATVSRIVLLISKDFVKLILVALVIAIPAAYYAVYKWLENFPYRIPIGWWIFALAGIAALAIALITISLQALRAAVANPVKNLRID